jgi:hypothetical protein
MDKEKYKIKFIKPSHVFNKTFHSNNPEAVVQKMTDAGYVVLECLKIKKEEKSNDNVLLFPMPKS